MRKNIKKLALVSAVAVSAICGFEGYREYAYRDAVGVPTIGYGTTKGVKMGDTTTRQEAKEFVVRDASVMARQMQSVIKVPLYQHEWDSLVSLVYNIGIGNFKKSTLLKKLNRRDYSGACSQIKRWVYAGGKKLKGLERRRESEYQMCIGNVK